MTRASSENTKLDGVPSSSSENSKISYGEIRTLLDQAFAHPEKNVTYDNLSSFLQLLVGKYGLSEIEDRINPPETDEPILNPDNHKFTAFPIKYQTIWDKYKEQMACFWKAEEIDFSGDYADFKSLTKEEQHFVEMVLAFFASSDGIVNFNLSERFTRDVKITEAQFAYQFQIMMENVHCVSGDTLILTDKGYQTIGVNVDKEVKVWNGKEFSKTVFKYTGDSKLYRIKLTNGMILDCTPNHKWFMRTGNQLHPERCKREVILTKNLKVRDVVWKYELPVVDTPDTDEFKNPYIHGFFCGDGTYSNGYPIVYLYDEKKKLLPYFGIESCRENAGRFEFYITTMINKQKYEVPINHSKNVKLRWLEGLCDSDGCINENRQCTQTSVQIGNTNLKFLKDVQLLLTTLGVCTKISKGADERQELMPDGKGGKKLYDCKKSYVLYITGCDVRSLIDLGFNPKRLVLKSDPTIIAKPECIKIKSIKILDGKHKTFCFTEQKEHAGIFNGILTGQSETYSLMLDNIIKDQSRKDFLFHSIETVPSVKRMADWAFKWIDSPRRFAYRVVAFACVELIFFSGAFAAIFWLKSYKNKNRDESRGRPFMNGLITSNKFIARDEGLHGKYACELYSLLNNKLPREEVNKIVIEAVIIAKSFMDDALPIRLIGMNNDMMGDYIEYIADRLLSMLNYPKIYNKNNPFKFMEKIGLDDKTNFFELRPTEYQDSHIMNKSKGKKNITINDDF